MPLPQCERAKRSESGYRCRSASEQREASHAPRSEPAKRRARARVGESEGRSPSDNKVKVREGFEPSNSGFAGHRVCLFATAPGDQFAPLTVTVHCAVARAGAKQTDSLQAW